MPIKLIIIIILSLCGILMLSYYARRRRPFASFLFGALTGAAALFVIHYFGDSIQMNVMISPINLAISLILGIPGAILVGLVGLLKP